MPLVGIASLAADLRAGRVDSVSLTERYLERAATDNSGAWRTVMPERALAMAREADDLFRLGVDRGPLQGIPVAIKDNMDSVGEATLAGLDPQLVPAPAAADSDAVARLAAAGAVIMGRCHMTELAFTALGTSLQGTPRNQPDPLRVPGGSSSGSAVAVAAGEVPVALGSDTGGSIRIPACCNGIVGFKPGAGTVNLQGVFPLSTSLDTIGPLARSVADAELIHSLLDDSYRTLGEPGELRVLVPETVLLDDLDERVAADFEALLDLVTSLGFGVERRPLPLLQEIRDARRYGSFAGWESMRDHGELLERGGELIGVGKHILGYRDRDPADYARLVAARAELRERFRRDAAGFDVILSPTMPNLPPLLEDVAEPTRADELDALGLRNTQLFNFLALPVLALPMGHLTGVSIAVHEGRDDLAFAFGRLLEAARA